MCVLSPVPRTAHTPRLHVALSGACVVVTAARRKRVNKCACAAGARCVRFCPRCVFMSTCSASRSAYSLWLGPGLWGGWVHAHHPLAFATSLALAAFGAFAACAVFTACVAAAYADPGGLLAAASAPWARTEALRHLGLQGFGLREEPALLLRARVRGQDGGLDAADLLYDVG